LAVILALRIVIIAGWHVPAGDGSQYYRLAQELRAHRRFAFAPPPTPPTYTRLPGYPLLAAVLFSPVPVSLEGHLRAAVAWNLVFDLGGALCVAWLVRRLGQSRRRALMAGAATLLSPTLMTVACYALTETPSTFLGTLVVALVFAAVARQQVDQSLRRARRLLLAAGALTGMALLMRADALTLVAGVGALMVFEPGPRRRRATMLALFFGAAALVFAPWPLRNLVLFGKPYWFSTTLRTMQGKPIPDGVVMWSRTWSGAEPGESFWELQVVSDIDVQIYRPGVILPAMYDSEAEHQELLVLFQRYNRERLTPAVDQGFRELARRRAAAHPVRTYFWLPLKRVRHMFGPEPPYELQLRVPALGLPQAHRWLIDWPDYLLYVFAFAGLVVLWRRGGLHRAFSRMAVVIIVTRVWLYSWVMPHCLTKRYLVEVLPLFLVFAFSFTLRSKSRDDEPRDSRPPDMTRAFSTRT
jgi:hypothetical protein